MSGENDEQERTPAPPRDGAWRRLARAAVPRSTRAQVLGAVLTVALGFAIATQVQQTQEGGLDAMRQDDLVRVLDDVSQRSTRLDQQASELQSQREQLAAGAGSSQAAITSAERRLDTLRLLAGTVSAHGPGIRMTIVDPGRQVTAPMLLDVLQELRDAGAEVIQFGGTRIVAGSWFAATGTDLQVDGQPLTRPVVVLAIGDPQTMASAMSIPGGIVETVRRQGATATVEQLPTVTVDALASPRTPRYAQPVPDAATPTP
ncbi:DUF881 domain-containing protein [Lapillicoccus sp.]|uniref:DUF881 domain-containing protein n=1 Tax=Lapillicoccus sp. TaxID=1909287 RepID=UPI0025FBCA8E|nr:DUF881 domain-containing protein [Lapillicoccus sp.]